MAAPNMTVSRIGQTNLSGDAQALFLTQYAGEVLTTFRNATKFLDKHLIRTIPNGDSAQFPVMGTGSAEYHTPGTMITGEQIAHAEKIINIDGLLIAPRFLASIDEAMNHYDVRSMYTQDSGRSLALQFDSHVAAVLIKNARTAATISGNPAGKQIFSVDEDEFSTTASDGIWQSIFAAQTQLDDNNIPEDGRFCALRPDVYNGLVASLTPVNELYNGDASNGSIAKGKVYELAGFQLVKTNQLPHTNIVTGPSAYQGDFTGTVALCWHPSAAGTVKLLDLAMDMEYSAFHQGWLVVAKYAYGHGGLRPEASVELTTAAS